MSLLPKLIHKFNAVPIKTQASFVDIDKLILKFKWKGTGTRIPKTVLTKKKVGGITPDIKT